MSRRPIYTERLGNLLVSNAKKSNNLNYHIISSYSGKWPVVRAGSSRASRNFSTQKQAATYAKRVASKGGGEIVIHDVNGGIAK